jgi:hypothetical protein
MSKGSDAWEARKEAEEREAAQEREARKGLPPVFSRRTFFFFILLAPVSFLALAGILLTLQYKQFQALLSPAPQVREWAWTEENRRSLDSLRAAITNFSSASGPDTLRFSPADITLLGSASPVLQRRRILFRATSHDSLLFVETTQPVDALEGRLAWVFKRIAPPGDRWLNARLEGLPEWKAGVLGLALQSGYLNGDKMPRAALTKRAGMSVRDFLDASAAAPYNAFLASIDTVYLAQGDVMVVRTRK